MVFVEMQMLSLESCPSSPAGAVWCAEGVYVCVCVLILTLMLLGLMVHHIYTLECLTLSLSLSHSPGECKPPERPCAVMMRMS